MSQRQSVSIILAITGVLLFSSKAVLVKLAYQYGVDTLSLLLLRMLFSLPFYLVVALIKRPEKSSNLKSSDYAWLIFFGLIGYYLASYFDFLGLVYIKASLERLVLFIYPTLVLLISWIVFRKKITGRQALGVAITYLGVVVIFFSELTIRDEDRVLLGGSLVFLSALTYAGYLVGSGWLIPKFGATVFTSYAMIISCGAVILHYGLTHPLNLFDLSMEVYLLGFIMAVFATVIPSYLISYAIRGIGANNFSVFGSLGPVSTIGLAYLFLDESLTVVQIIGAGVIIGGIVLAEKKGRK